MQRVFQKTLQETLYYKNIPALIYVINYPFFITTCNIKAGLKINEYYSNTAKNLEEYCRTVLYQQAVETVKYIFVEGTLDIDAYGEGTARKEPETDA